MRVPNRRSQSPRRSHPAAVFVALALAILASAPATFARSARDETAGVKNFGRVTERYFRGGEVTPEGVGNLAKLGVRTIVDLRDDPGADEPAACQRFGIEYLNIPLTGHDTLEHQVVDRILAIIQNAQEPVYVHCSAGKQRAGAIAALYRMRVQGWSKEKTWAEQESYGFGMPEEHPELYASVYGAPTKPAAKGTPAEPATKGLSADADYIPLSSAIRTARAGGAIGDVLKVDLEWDKERSVVTWDVTFSSGTEYEVEAVSGKLLDSKPKSPAKLAVFSPLPMKGSTPSGIVTFQEIIRRAETSHGRTVMEMELKQVKGHPGAVYQVDTADDATLYFDATTGNALEGLDSSRPGR